MSGVLGFESQRNPVVAVALPGGARTVVEDVALVTAAALAVVFRAGHDQLEVDAGANGIGQGFPEAGPTGAAVVLGF